jgi:hypothetical protein
MPENRYTRPDSELALTHNRQIRIKNRAHLRAARLALREQNEQEGPGVPPMGRSRASAEEMADDDGALACGTCDAPVDHTGKFAGTPDDSASLTCPHCGAPVKHAAALDDAPVSGPVVPPMDEMGGDADALEEFEDAGESMAELPSRTRDGSPVNLSRQLFRQLRERQRKHLHSVLL